MCLILLAWRVHPGFPLVVAANRDEYHARPTAAAGFWTDHAEVLAGRDLEAGGTWLGVTRQGRFGALTNYRDPARHRSDAPSRGRLVSDFLAGRASAADYLAALAPQAEAYNGFNLLVGDGQDLFWYSNRGAAPRRLAPGLYGLSNELLDSPWPKVAAAKSQLATALSALPAVDPLFRLLRDERTYPDDVLPRTGISLELERMLSAAFIRNARYGTRGSTVLLCDAAGRTILDEQGWRADGSPGERRRFVFSTESTARNHAP